MTLKISPFFFLMAAFIGFINSLNLYGTLLWIIVIFLSIIVHEMGHALFFRLFGLNVHVELTLFGGVTYPKGGRLSLPKEFITTLAGPVFGFGLFILASLLLASHSVTDPTILYLLNITRLINLIWTVLNLVPVLPLDGGQLLRIVFEFFGGYEARQKAFVASMCIAFLAGLVFIFMQLYIISVLFFMFAFQNYEVAKQLKGSSEEDESEILKQDLIKAENLFLQGKLEEAISALEEIRARSRRGMLYQIATQDLAKVYMKQEKFQEAYKILKPLSKVLSDTGKILLHAAAFEVGDYRMVLNLAGHCLVTLPDSDMVLHSAAAAAALKDLKASIGWLETARDYGCEKLKDFLEEKHFNSIRGTVEFKQFLKSLTQS
jgi:stage IV sporulation protein FB